MLLGLGAQLLVLEAAAWMLMFKAATIPALHTPSSALNQPLRHSSYPLCQCGNAMQTLGADDAVLSQDCFFCFSGVHSIVTLSEMGQEARGQFLVWDSRRSVPS